MSTTRRSSINRTRLARELFEVGIAERDRRLEITDWPAWVDHAWNNLQPSAKRAWRAVARHVMKTYVKKG